MSTVITVENLGKKYTLHHQQREPYTALRDVLTNGFLSFSKKIFSPLKSHSPSLPAVEDFWALKDVSFEVKQGDRIGIIGRNGAGKSTLLKILSRITEPTTGSVRIKGRVASLLEVGTGFHPELTGRENVFLNGAILGMSRAEIRKKFDEIVDFAEIEKFLDTPVKRYSSGMYVRLAFAVAAHLEPEILIVDEVLAVGDAQFQKKCLGKMEDVSTKEGRTVLFVSHNMPSVRALCSQGILIEKGQIVRQGSADDVINFNISSIFPSAAKVIDLRSARRTAGKIKAIQKAWIENIEGEVVTSVLMGSTIYLCFSFNLEGYYSCPDFGYGIESLDGMRIFSANNTVLSSKSLNVISSGVARCEISNIPLMPGKYLISLSIVDNQVEWIDFIERAISLDVVAYDVFGTGKIFEPSQGIIFTQAKVTISEE